jgi:hypothetical protein
VSERLGHADIALTLNTYSHAIPALQETAASVVANLVLGATEWWTGGFPSDSGTGVCSPFAAAPPERASPASGTYSDRMNKPIEGWAVQGSNLRPWD